ncbi:glutaminase A [Pseudonocardia sp.]|uniref:glutaminase A n=1 Tax=Pseudonocardia sp. TaxID=60912 RepID=UPI0026151DB4|nr:glutaminase A [Pseudonocardia sp.]
MSAFVSTGSLPAPERVQELVDQAHARFRGVRDGAVSTVYPALAAVAPEGFGVAVTGVTGALYAAGDARTEFTIMSVAKPFVFALVCGALGPAQARLRVGANATGLAFNSLAAVEAGPGGRTNPMVNSGAVATAGLVPGRTLERRWQLVLDGLSRFAGRQLALDPEVHRSAAATNHRNRALAQLLHSLDALDADPDETVELYTRQSCVAVTAADLATMGATLADGGVHPVTREQVVGQPVFRAVLSVMATAGLYETSGDWLYEVGLPGKSGIGGGMVTVSPGKGALGTFAPPLDAAGNSVRGRLTAEFLSRELGLDLFASAPGPPRAAGPGRAAGSDRH